MASGNTPTVSSVERALRIFELLAATKAGSTLPEISRRLGLPKSSTHCLLLTLERSGYLTCDKSSRRFTFGLKLFSLAKTAAVGVRLREQARPFLRSLMSDTGLTVHMGILEQNEVVLVEKIDSAVTPKLATWLGKRMDLHCTGLGKAVLAFLPEQAVGTVVKSHGLPRHNENTIASIRRLHKEMAEVRRLGYALDDEEEEIGTRCLGAPIFDLSRQVFGAVSVAGTTDQITSENVALYAEKVKQTAASVSQALQLDGEGENALAQAI